MRNKEVINTSFIAISRLYKQKTQKELSGDTAREKIKNFFLGVPEQLSVHMYGRSYTVFLKEKTFVINF